MDTIICIKTRRSRRNLLPGLVAVEKETIEKIVDCGRFAPTANNLQPCDFIVITSRQMLQKLSNIAVNGSFMKSSAFCIIVVAKEIKYYLEDGCAATENILLAVHDCGLSACWVAGDKKDYADSVLQLLGVPSEYKLISIIPVGFSDQNGNIDKRELKDVLHWEKF